MENLAGANSSNKNFFQNPNNEINKPGSNHRIESRKGVLSRKDSINKNNFYMQKGLGSGLAKVPDILPNKPTVPESYMRDKQAQQANVNLPVLSNPYQNSVVKNSIDNKQKLGYVPYKYSGIGGLTNDYTSPASSNPEQQNL